MSNLGINTIGSLERPSIIAGDFPRVTAERVAAQDLALGSIVYKDSNDNTIKLVSDDSEPIYGIVAGDVSAGNPGVVWLTGEFVGPRLTVGSGIDWTELVDIARNKSIFLKDANLAPNQ